MLEAPLAAPCIDHACAPIPNTRAFDRLWGLHVRVTASGRLNFLDSSRNYCARAPAPPLTPRPAHLRLRRAAPLLAWRPPASCRVQTSQPGLPCVDCIDCGQWRSLSPSPAGPPTCIPTHPEPTHLSLRGGANSERVRRALQQQLTHRPPLPHPRTTPCAPHNRQQGGGGDEPRGRSPPSSRWTQPHPQILRAD